jgi:branched-chain amino acid transport system ATP-binding protein
VERWFIRRNEVALLDITNLSKSFGGLAAVNVLDMSVNEGEIVGLIGPNGSGKTTLFNLISGLIKPESGSIVFHDNDITGIKPYKICRMGIARTFQLVRPFLRTSPLENVMVGRIYGKEQAKSIRQAKGEAQEILQFVGLGEKRVPRAAMLSLVDRKRLEIARALATKPKLLLLDEMIAGLNPTEVEDAMALLSSIRDSGVTLIIVEHVIKAVFGISDRVVVLNMGMKIAEGTPEEIAHNKDVIQAYLGEDEDA